MNEGAAAVYEVELNPKRAERLDEKDLVGFSGHLYCVTEKRGNIFTLAIWKWGAGSYEATHRAGEQMMPGGLDSSARAPAVTQEWDKSAPDWEGAEGVEFLMSDGTIIDGEFDMEDHGFDGESSYPIWDVELADGRRMSFYAKEIKGWREKPPGAA